VAERRLLIVAHTPSPNTARLLDAVVEGARSVEADGVSILSLSPFKASADDVMASDGVVLGTPENIGYMSGALKDFFDRCYCPCLEKTQGLPYAAFIRAGNDGTGACRSIETVVTGLRWRRIHAPVVCRGAWCDSFLDECRELGALFAAGLDAGVF
jgi:multimeric flavodoxin WrbA